MINALDQFVKSNPLFSLLSFVAVLFTIGAGVSSFRRGFVPAWRSIAALIPNLWRGVAEATPFQRLFLACVLLLLIGVPYLTGFQNGLWSPRPQDKSMLPKPSLWTLPYPEQYRFPSDIPGRLFEDFTENYAKAFHQEEYRDKFIKEAMFKPVEWVATVESGEPDLLLANQNNLAVSLFGNTLETHDFLRNTKLLKGDRLYFKGQIKLINASHVEIVADKIERIPSK